MITTSKLYNIGRSTLPSIAVGLLIGRFLMSCPFSVFLLLSCGIIATLVIFKKPELGILSIVVLVCSLVFEKDLPLIRFGFGSFQITDIILFILLLKTAYTILSEEKIRFVKSPLEVPLLLFVFVSMCSAFNSIFLQGVDINDVFRIFRVTTYYLLFYIITHLVKSKEQVKFLIISLFVIASIVAIAMLVQTAAGDSVEVVPGGLKSAGGLDEEYNSIRLQPPGQTLIYISFIAAIYFFLFQKNQKIFSKYFFLITLLGLGILLTYNRTYLVTIFLSMCVYLFLSKREDRKRLMTLVTRCATVMLIIVMVFGGRSGKLEDLWYAVSHRYLTLFAGSDLIQSSSLNDRRLENGWAIDQIMAHPVTGIGLGKDYRPQLYGSQDEIAYYVHNVYLWLMMDMGIFGFIFFIWFYAGFVTRALKNYKKPEDGFLRSVATGSTFAGIGMLFMALVIPLFMEWHSIVVIAIFSGLSEAIILISDPQTGEKSNLVISEKVISEKA